MMFVLAGILTQTGRPLSETCKLKLQSLCHLLDFYTPREGQCEIQGKEGVRVRGNFNQAVKKGASRAHT